jgi:hypothetical protein
MHAEHSRDLYTIIHKMTGLADKLLEAPGRPIEAGELAQVAAAVSDVAARLRRQEGAKDGEAYRNLPKRLHLAR